MVAEASLSKPLYKIELYLLKVIPMAMVALCLANTTLFYFGIDATILTYMGGVSFLTLGFLYLSSYVFKFCAYHRMFLHYINVPEDGEQAAYLIGYLIQKMHRVFTNLIERGAY